MATGGRLSTAERAALTGGGARIRQTFEIGRPTASGSTTYIYTTVDDGLHAQGGDSRIVRAGRRKHTVWNPHPTDYERPKATRWTFTARNDDGWLYRNGDAWVIPSVYTATPQECLVRHRVYVYAAGAWSEIGHMAFVGRIVSIRYEDTSDSLGQTQGAVAHITTEQEGAWGVLRYIWTPEDGDHHAMTHPDYPTSGLDFIWST